LSCDYHVCTWGSYFRLGIWQPYNFKDKIPIHTQVYGWKVPCKSKFY
jgi:hypothetical protein